MMSNNKIGQRYNVRTIESIKNQRHNKRSTTTFVNPPMDDKEENITLTKGQEFTITLDSNPTSGFKWLPKFDGSIINLVSHDFQSSTTKRIGSSGKDIFIFLAISSGSDKLKMFYKRSWEEQFVAEKVFVINVK
jgi:inhibitor of cysteine peptidase